MTTVPPMPEYHDEPMATCNSAEWTLIEKLRRWGTAGWAKVQELEATLEEAHEATGIFGVDEPMSLLDSIHALKAKLEEAERERDESNETMFRSLAKKGVTEAQAAALAEALEKTLPYCVAALSDGELSTVSAALQTYREGR